MNAKRLHFMLIAVICLLLVSLFGAALSINKALTARATTLTQLKAKSAALEREQATLKKTAKDVTTYTELQKITQAIVPEDKSQAQAVREIVKIANENGVRLSAITFPASNLGSSSPSAKSGSSSKSTSSSSSSGSTSKKSDLSQLTAVKNIPGVYQLPITVQSDKAVPVRYDRFINFLSALERNRRTAQVSTITLVPSKDNRNYLSFTLTLNNYIKP